MNIKFIDQFTIDIYVKKEVISNINFNNKNELEQYLKDLFKILKNKYNIKIEGFYDIEVYIDKYYGFVFHLEKEDLEYYSYFKNQVDMRIITINTNFLYEVDNIPLNILKKIKPHFDKNSILIELRKELTPLEMMNLLENSSLIYNK